MGDVFKIGQGLKVAKKVNSVKIMTTQKCMKKEVIWFK